MCFSFNLLNFTYISNILRPGTHQVCQLRLANTSLLAPKWFEIENFFHPSSPVHWLTFHLYKKYVIILFSWLYCLSSDRKMVSSCIVHAMRQEILAERNINMNLFFLEPPAIVKGPFRNWRYFVQCWGKALVFQYDFNQWKILLNNDKQFDSYHLQADNIDEDKVVLNIKSKVECRKPTH